MATLFPDSMSNGKITPEYIQGKLFSFYLRAHKLHLDTPSYEEHKALNELYEGLVDYTDEISEKLMGYIGRRIPKNKIDDIPSYIKGEPQKLCREIISFSYDVYEWAGEMHYCDIENKAQELSGLAAKVNYFLSLT